MSVREPALTVNPSSSFRHSLSAATERSDPFFFNAHTFDSGCSTRNAPVTRIMSNEIPDFAFVAFAVPRQLFFPSSPTTCSRYEGNVPFFAFVSR